LDSELDITVGEIIELQSAIDDRRLERRKTGIGLAFWTPITLLLLAAGVVFGGYMWWFIGLWGPMFCYGVFRLARMVWRDQRDTERLCDLGFRPSD